MMWKTKLKKKKLWLNIHTYHTHTYIFTLFRLDNCENTSVVLLWLPCCLLLFAHSGDGQLEVRGTGYFHLHPFKCCWDTAALCLRHSSNQSLKTAYKGSLIIEAAV